MTTTEARASVLFAGDRLNVLAEKVGACEDSEVVTLSTLGAIVSALANIVASVERLQTGGLA
jgi:hypothetical protein